MLLRGVLEFFRDSSKTALGPRGIKMKTNRIICLVESSSGLLIVYVKKRLTIHGQDTFFYWFNG